MGGCSLARLRGATPGQNTRKHFNFSWLLARLASNTSLFFWLLRVLHHWGFVTSRKIVTCRGCPAEDGVPSRDNTARGPRHGSLLYYSPYWGPHAPQDRTADDNAIALRGCDRSPPWVHRLHGCTAILTLFLLIRGIIPLRVHRHPNPIPYNKGHNSFPVSPPS